MSDQPYRVSRYIDIVRNRMHDRDEDAEEATAVAAFENDWNGISLDMPLNGEEEEEIFHELVSSDKIICIIIPPNAQVNSMKGMLRKAIRTLPNLRMLDLAISLTEMQAESILAIVGSSPTLNNIGLYLSDCSDGLARPLARFLRGSPPLALRRFSLLWDSLTFAGQTGSVPISQTALSYIYDAIGECQTLNNVYLYHAPSSNTGTNTAAEALACAVAKSSTVNGVAFAPPHRRSFGDKFCSALMRTDAVKNFDLCCTLHQDANYRGWMLSRNPPWKPLLSQDIPLALWPRILAKTSTWDKETSHTPLDALLFLTKEKSDVLVQNVHRRKIRKRKRFQMS